MNLNPLSLEQLEGGDGNIREELIDVAGDEESDVHERKLFQCAREKRAVDYNLSAIKLASAEGKLPNNATK